jgi:methionyl-tRNA formyltransferase
MGEDIVGIFTIPKEFRISWSPDKPVVNVRYKDFKRISEAYNTPVVEVTKKLSSAEYVEVLKEWKPDFILVAGWYYMVPRVIREIPPLGCAGLHASLLPKYRGGAPLVWAIINGEKETGITLFYLADGVDDGDIIGQKKIFITLKDDIKTVYEKIEDATLTLLEETLPKIKEGKMVPIKNEIEKGSIFRQRKPEDGLINWNSSSLDIYNFIRAQTYPYPGAFTFFKEERLTIWKATFFDFIQRSGSPGEVIDIVDKDWARGFVVATKEGDIPLLIQKVGTQKERFKEAIEYAKENGFGGEGVILSKTHGS